MYYILINPHSQSGRGAKHWQALEALLRRQQIPYQAFFTEGSHHATRIAKQLTAPLAGSNKQLHLVVLGGDGTFNEAVNGICNFENVILSYIPTGSSNDFARDLGLPKDPLQAFMQMHQNKRSLHMDIGLARYTFSDGLAPLERRFVVSTGIGYDAAVCEEVSKAPLKPFLNKLGLGKLVYLGIGLKRLFAADCTGTELIVDNEEPIPVQNMFFAAAMLHRYEGGGFMFCPEADACDGQLDICLVRKIPKFQLPVLLPSAFLGKHTRFSCVNMYRGEKMILRAQRPLYTHTDGEVNGQVISVSVTCQKDRLHLLY